MNCPGKRKTWILAALLSVSTVASGCRNVGWLSRNQSVEAHVAAIPTFRTFASPLFRTHRPRRVVILESGPSAESYNGTEKLIAEIASRIRGEGGFEIVVPKNERLSGQPDNILNGEYDEREIARISREYNADAIAIVRVNSLKTFAPMQISATLAIVDCNESVVVFGVDGSWDNARPATRNEFRNFVETSRGLSESGHSSREIFYQSPGLMTGYVASQITDALLK